VRSWLRAARLMLGIGWEVGAPLLLGFAGLSVAGSLGPFFFALGLRPLVDGIDRRRPDEVVAGAVVCGLALLVLVAAPSAALAITPRFRERSIMVMQRRMLTLAAGAPYLDHFERPDFWDRLQVLQRSYAELLMSIGNVLVGPVVVAQLLATAILLARLQPVLLLLPLIAVPAVLLNRRGERMRREAEARTAEPRRAIAHLFELASGAHSGREIRVYGLRQELVGRHRRLSDDVARASERALLASAGLSLLGWLVFALAYTGAVLLTLRAAAGGSVSPGDVALTLGLTTALAAAAGGLAAITDQLVRAMAVAEHYEWLAGQAGRAGPGAASDPRVEVPRRLVRGLQLRGVSFAYPGGGRTILEDVDLDLPAGGVIALVGENGAGKTTLVKLLSRLYPPSRGRILLDGIDLDRLDLAEYRRRLAAGFQDFMRFELLVREAVGVGDPPRLGDARAVDTALRRAGAEFARRLPGGLETQLGPSWEGGVDLSGGEWQKLALARAMMRPDPLLLVFDEPTASLDPQTEQAIFERVAAEARAGAASGRVTLLVSHRFSTVRMADLIVVLEGGRVAGRGSHAELMAQGGLYAELYELQSAAYR
jgi:ATP-binding cassette subfamily B protein